MSASGTWWVGLGWVGLGILLALSFAGSLWVGTERSADPAGLHA